MFRQNQAFSGFSVDDIPKAKAFYSETLGMDVTEEDGMLQLKIANGNTVMVYPKGDAHTPATYTILNFPVDNIEQTVDELTAKGVKFERYDGFDQDEKGIAHMEGLRQAWFEDPAGNIFSVLQVL